MAVSDRMTGAGQYIAFVVNGGTVVISGDSRNLDIEREQELADVSAGADGARSSKATLKNYSASMEAVFIGTAGSATMGSADIGVEGILLWGPKGTAAGQPKGAWPMIVNKASLTAPFDDVIMLNIEFTGQGAEISNPNKDTW